MPITPNNYPQRFRWPGDNGKCAGKSFRRAPKCERRLNAMHIKCRHRLKLIYTLLPSAPSHTRSPSSQFPLRAPSLQSFCLPLPPCRPHVARRCRFFEMCGLHWLHWWINRGVVEVHVLGTQQTLYISFRAKYAQVAEKSFSWKSNNYIVHLIETNSAHRVFCCCCCSPHLCVTESIHFRLQIPRKPEQRFTCINRTPATHRHTTPHTDSGSIFASATSSMYCRAWLPTVAMPESHEVSANIMGGCEMEPTHTRTAHTYTANDRDGDTVEQMIR